MERDDRKQQEEKTSFYPLPPPPWFDGVKYLERLQQVVEIDENTGLQKVAIYKI